MILHSLREEHGVEPPIRFYLDFESAAMKAVRRIYPESSIIGCDTHFKRTIRKNLQKKGLLKTYNQDSSLQSFVRSLWALSLVPLADVLSVWENYIKKIFRMTLRKGMRNWRNLSHILSTAGLEQYIQGLDLGTNLCMAMIHGTNTIQCYISRTQLQTGTVL